MCSPAPSAEVIGILFPLLGDELPRDHYHDAGPAP